LRQGESSSVTVTVLSANGFNSAVALSASWIGTAPAGVDLTITSPITPSSSEIGFGHLIITASPSASVGTFAVQVTGTSGSLTHSLGSNIAVTILQAVSTRSSTSSTTSSTTSVATLPTTCPISTATSGSALAPLAQGLRVFRDQSIMKTRTGAAFMTLFNAWYYSFSPPLASYFATHRTQRVAFSYTLYPLIGLLYASYYTYMLVSPLNNEVGAVAAGLVAAAMIGFVYVALPLYLAKRIFRRKTSLSSRLNPKNLLAASAASSVAIVFSYFAGMGLALGLATASLLLSILTLGVMAGILLFKRVKITYLAQQLAVLNEVCKTLPICAMKVLKSGAAED